MSQKTDTSQVNFDFLFKNHPIPMWIYDIKTLAFLEVNDAAVEKYGYSRKKFLSMTLKDIRPKEDVPRLLKDVSKKRPALQHSGRWQHKLNSGKVIDVEITSHTIDYNGHKAALVIAQDITDKKREREKNTKLSRIYNVLSNVNQAIVRIKDGDKLFKEVCNIVVVEGKFVMAWIGIVNPGTNKVDVAASSGDTFNYLKSVNIDLNDTKRSQGPTGICIKNGSHQINNDLENNPKFSVWKKSSIKSGFRSLASFPLIVSKKVIGAFNIYSNEVGFFDEDEIKLFDELTMDISFALEFIEGEKERQKAEDSLKLSETTYRGIINSVTEAIYIQDENVLFLDVNSASEKMYGYKRDYFIGRTPEFLSAPGKNDLEKVKQAVQNAYNGIPQKFEFWGIDKDGRVFPKDVSLSSGIYFGKKAVIAVARDITERKHSVEKLRESEERFRNLVENINEVFYISDGQGNIFYCSPNITTTTGYSLKEIIGKTFLRLVAPVDRQLVIGHYLDQTVKGVSDTQLVFRVRCKDGKIVWAEQITHIVRDTAGSVVEYRNVARDITERKLVEEELRKSREDLLKFFEDDISADFITTPSGKLLQCNKTFLKLFGFKSKEEALAFPFEKLYPDTSGRNRFIDLVKKNIKLKNFEGEYVSPDGRIIYTLENAAGEFDKTGELIQIRGYIVDITDRKKAELELRKLSRAVEQGPASVVITNQDGDIEYVNEPFCKLTGYSKEEVIGKNPRILKSGHQEKRFYEELWDTILSGKDWKGEMQNKKKNGDLFWVSMMISPLVNNEGDITHFVSIKEDITEKKKMIDNLIKAKESAEQSNKVKDAFIANMSHEIRTPLNGIMGMTSLIKESYSQYITGEDKELFTGIDHSSKRIIRTVDMILNYSRLQVGEYSATLKEIELSSICDSLAVEFMISAKYKGLELSFENKCNSALIKVDEYSVTQAISNLIDNAIKYTNSGYVKVILYKNSDDEIMIEITDSGIGMSEEYTEHIFEPYIQEDVGYGRIYEGIGLGLSLVKKFLDLNNADISVVSKKGEGTTFTVKFKAVI